MFKWTLFCIILWIVLATMMWLSGCNGTGIERKTLLLSDEFLITQGIDTEDNWKLAPELKIGFKLKFK